MNIDLKWITIREIVSDYIDNDIEGIRGYAGKLNIRPKYQREFVYDGKKQKLVINSIVNNFPLNVMYWVVNNQDSFEILDGQQRTVSFCRYVECDYSTIINGRMAYFHSLTPEEQESILDYKIAVYFCTGTDKEIIDWFEIINIAGERLTAQELRNAVYTGDWLSDAKIKFSKPNCGAYLHGRDYVNGSPIRQEILETALAWITGSKDDIIIRDYMSLHQHDENADELWNYFQSVIDWVKKIFADTQPEMKGLDWGRLYEKYHEQSYDSSKVSDAVQRLYGDYYIKNKNGIFEYILGGENETKLLEIRVFDDAVKQSVYKQQTAIAKSTGISNCPFCAIGHDANKGKIWDFKEMDADHVAAWSKGGATDIKNCQMLCKTHNQAKGNK